MPPPPKSRDPRETFGFGRKPFSDYFDVPKGAAFDPAFSPAARQTLLEDEQYTRDRDNLRREWETEDQANELLDAAPNMRPRQVERELMRNPKLLATPQGQTLQEFLATRGKRQEVRRERSKAEQLLAGSFVKTIDDPRMREEFNGLISQGVPFEQARDQIWSRGYNQKHAVTLAEVGVPDTEFEGLKSNGQFDPVLVARRVAKAKEEAASGRRGGDEVDKRIDMLTEALRTRERVLTTRGEDPLKDPLYSRYSDELDKAYGVKLSPPVPVVDVPATLGGATPQPDVRVPFRPVETEDAKLPSPEAAVAFQEGLLPEEAAQRFRAKQEQATIGEQVARAWTEAKSSLTPKILEKYPDKEEPYGNPAVLAARAILMGKTVSDDTSASVDDYGRRAAIPYTAKVLKDIGMEPGEVLFKEPGNERWGSQDVRNTEALEAWARDFLVSKGLLQTGEPSVEELDLSEEDAALLNKYLE